MRSRLRPSASISPASSWARTCRAASALAGAPGPGCSGRRPGSRGQPHRQRRAQSAGDQSAGVRLHRQLTLVTWDTSATGATGELQLGPPSVLYLPHMSEREYRIEHDSMGEVRVPKAAKWQAQTQRAVENFPISGTTVERSLISALAAIKGAAALENARLKVIDKKVAAAIHEAGQEVAAGQWDQEFPIDVFQTGSGTSTNMNMNEVLATLATERLGSQGAPQRRRQRLAVVQRRVPLGHPPGRRHGRSRTQLIPALEHLAQALRKKSRAFKDVVKSGRTHLMDATPVTLGQEFGGYAAAVELGHRAAAGVPCPGSPSCRSAGRRSGRASTPPGDSPGA